MRDRWSDDPSPFGVVVLNRGKSGISPNSEARASAKDVPVNHNEVMTLGQIRCVLDTKVGKVACNQRE